MPGGPGRRPPTPRGGGGPVTRPGTPATLATPGPSLQGGGGSSGGGGFGGSAPDANPELLLRGTGPNPEYIMRDFTQGMHVNPARDAIAEQDLWWCENLQPLASGNLQPVSSFGPFAPVGASGEGQAYYVTQVSIGGAPFIFAAYTSGSAYIFNCLTGVATKIMTNLLNTSTLSTYVVSWMGKNFTNSGILIIDPNGYWDYNLTTASTLTSLSNTVTAVTNTFKTTIAGGNTLKQVVTSGGGTGGVFQGHYAVTSAVINAAGTGYVIGDILSLTDNSPVSPAQITVTNTGGGGTITGISLATGGDYPGPTTSGLVATGPSGAVVTGGTGTGATFNVDIQIFKMVIVNPGHGFTIPTTIADQNAGSATIDSWSLTIGTLSGNSIATYAGRVWIGNGNTLTYSDVNSYNSFGGAGGQSTFSDQYLLQGITCLYAANNYLYMFGIVSVDVISNVQVNATTGLTSFSRVNVLQGIGVSSVCVMTVIGFQRGVAFLDTTGYYLLAGATPERLSERIQACIRASDLLGGHVRPSAALCNVNNELCLLLQLAVIPDSFAGTGLLNNRSVIFAYQRRRWWLHSTTFGNNLLAEPITGSPNFQNFGAYVLVQSGGGSQLQKLLTGGLGPWRLRTKLWDGAAGFREKQAINVALQCVWVTPGPLQATGVTVQLDSELQNSTAVAIPNIPNLYIGAQQSTGSNNGQYALQVVKELGALAQAIGSQFIGLTFTGDGSQVYQIEGIALRGKTERNMLE